MRKSLLAALSGVILVAMLAAECVLPMGCSHPIGGDYPYQGRLQDNSGNNVTAPIYEGGTNATASSQH